MSDIIATLTTEEREKAAELYKDAQTTPVVTMGVGHKDWATQAWDRLRDYLNELGKKYGYDPEKAGIDTNTGEVHFVEG